MTQVKSLIVYAVCMLFMILAQIGCTQNSIENKIYGTWEMSVFVSREDFRKLYSESLPADALTSLYFQKLPALEKLFQPIKGSTETFYINSITNTTMEIELDNPKLKLTLFKKFDK